jgi:hypothetical protein
MRFIAVMIVFLVIFALVGMTQSLLTGWSEEAGQAAASGAHETAGGLYRLRLTSTFDAERDPFALRTPGGEEPVRLLVRAGDRTLCSRTADWRRGEPLTIEGVDLKGVQADVFVMATPSDAEMQKPCGVRVELFREDGVLCDEQTLWAEAGAVLSRAAVFSLRPAAGRPEGGRAGEERQHE